MPTYFTPLRRKIGVLTLLMACVFAAGWVRSLVVLDRIEFSDFTGSPNKEHSIAGLGTKRHAVVLLAYELVEFDWQTPIAQTPFNLVSVSSDASQSEDDVKVDLDYGKPMMAIALPETGTEARGLAERRTGTMLLPVPFLVLPYWSIVIPLTLLSAWLLLSKPRAKAKPTPA
jgi:hypothetical protein